MGSSDLVGSIRKLFISIFILGFLASAVISCTTGEDSADGFEDELSSEVEQLEGTEESETTEVATDDATEDADESDGLSSDEKDTTKTAVDDGADGDSSEDDEFLAEDSAVPPNKENLEEKDLQNELEKEGATASVDRAANPSTDPAVTTEPVTPEPVTQQPPAAVAGTLTPGDVEDPLVEDGEVTLPNSAANSSPLARRDSSPDGFEIINPPVPQEDLGVSDPLVAEVDPPLPSVKAAQEIVPISKISKDPFFRNERLMNSVYVVRPNDDLAIISQKIFNDDKTSILFADNPHLSKGLETGDKVYYNSPNRPDDKKTIMTFYEDNKMAPQYYVTRRGDDIKKIGREVLGSDEGWKEIWSTNESLQTQALLPAGLKVRYWSGSEPRAYEEPQNKLASNGNDETTSAGGTMAQTPPPPSAPETLPEIPPSPEPANVISEDPGMMASAPSESLSSMQNSEVPSVKSAEEGTSILSVAAIAMIAMAGLGIVAIQIKNRKRDDGGMPPSLEFTKV